MSAYKKNAKLLGALLLAATATAAFSGAAQAESGWLWYDSVFAAPAAAPQQSVPVRRARSAQVSSVAPASRPMQVSSAASSPDCFWCNRRVYISGLSF
jgi:hypothetical protein